MAVSKFLNLDTDGTLASNSDERVASQKAIKTYVDAHSGGGGNSYTEDNLLAGQGISFITDANYRISGSPTITDGVASGFSNSNYLYFNSPLKDEVLTSFEFVTAINLTTGGYDGQAIIDPMGGQYALRVGLSSANKVWVRISNTGTASYVPMTGTTTITTGTKYWIKVTYSSTAGYDLYTSTDGSTWTTEVHGYSTMRPYQYIDSYYIGRNVTDGYYFRGSIYLEDTYFNVNGNRAWTAAASETTFVSLSETPLVNRNTYNNNGLTILGNVPASTSANATNIGVGSSCTGESSVAIGQIASASSTGTAVGKYARASQSNTTAIGANSYCGSSYSTAIGANAQATGQFSIQLGYGTNSTYKTMNVALSNSSSENYQLLDASGEIPVARLKAMTGAGASTAGAKGAVPAPAAGDNEKFLRGDGTWATTDISGKANVALDNLSDAGKIVSSNLAMPSSTTMEAITTAASGSTYTAPSNGYVFVNVITSGVQLISIEPQDAYGVSTLKAVSYSPVSGVEIAAICPVYKGQSFAIYYNTGTPSARFVYAIGSESEGNTQWAGGLND